MRKLTWFNKDTFFGRVKVGSTYAFDSYDFSRSAIRDLAGKHGVKIERGFDRFSFRIMSMPEAKKHEPALFDPKMLVVN